MNIRLNDESTGDDDSDNRNIYSMEIALGRHSVKVTAVVPYDVAPPHHRLYDRLPEICMSMI